MRIYVVLFQCVYM